MDFKTMFQEVQNFLDTIESNTSIATVLLTDTGNLHIAYCDIFDDCGSCRGYSALVR